jgi:hypothetical protein
MKQLVLWIIENQHQESNKRPFGLEISILEKGVKKTRLIDQFVVDDFLVAQRRIKENGSGKSKLTVVCDMVHWFQEMTMIPDLPLKQQYAHLELELEKLFPNYQEDFCFHHEKIKKKERVYFITSFVNIKFFNSLASFLKKVLEDLDLPHQGGEVMINPWQIRRIEKGNSLVIIPRSRNIQVQVFNQKHLTGFFQTQIDGKLTLEKAKLALMRINHGLLNQFAFDHIMLYFDQTMPKEWEKQFLDVAKSLFGSKIIEIHESWFLKKPNLACFRSLIRELEAVIKGEKRADWK